jgi:hypothetical protein
MNPNLGEVIKASGVEIDPDTLAEILASQDHEAIRIWNTSYCGALHTLNPKPTVWGCLCSEAGKRRPSPYVVRLHRRISKAAGARL